MALNAQDIARIANLARLELSSAESERMLGQLNDFFGIVEKMQAVDTSGVSPLSHPVAAIQDIALRLREDSRNVRSFPSVEKYRRKAPNITRVLSGTACSSACHRRDES